VADFSIEEDEFGATWVLPRGWKADHDYDPGWDYAPAEEIDPGELDALLAVLEETRARFEDLDFSPPAVWLGDTEDDHVARYIDGTEGAPIIVLDWTKFSPLSFSEQVDELRVTLLHEAGHAYFRAAGIDYAEDEESVVEEYARTEDVSVLEEYE
jgi:hypothetical protein